MKIVFLTSESAHHYYLINEIHKVYPVAKVFFQTVYYRPKPWSQKLKTFWNFPKLRLSIEERLMNLLFSKEKKEEEFFEQKIFFDGRKPFLDSSIKYATVSSFNQEETVTKVEAEAADLIIVFGTEILKGKILNTAKKAILNIHRGIVPKYKGGGMPTWVLYNKDFDSLGVTIHLCTANLDAGDIVGQEFYRLQKGDGMHTLRGQTTLLAAKLLKEVIADYSKDQVKYVKQGPGKTWRGKDLNIAKEIIARQNLHKYLQEK